MMDVHEYHSDIVRGGRYRDVDTQFEGVAVAVTFYRHGCERVQLRTMVSHVPVEHWFDAPTLERIDVDAKLIGFAVTEEALKDRPNVVKQLMNGDVRRHVKGLNGTR